MIIAPSLVGDRYVQLTPAYSGTGEVLTDGAELSVDETSQPLELDEIYDSLDRLNVALGPRGANKTGALSDLLSVTADNFGGQGTTFRQTIKDFSRLSATLADNKEELFGSVEALEGFMKTLADNDQTVRQFNQSLADVSTMLAGEREELVAATKNLSVALTSVKGFVEENKDSLSRNITGLNRVSKVLVRQRAALDEILHVAPGALNNLALTYNPQAGTLDTRANFGEAINQLEADPAALLCGFVGQVERSGQVCDTITDLLGSSRPGALDEADVLPAQDVFDPTPRWTRGGGAMKPLKALVLGVLAALFLSACDASVYSLPLPGGPDVGDDPMTVKVEFADVLDLVPQSTVKVNDVSVGKVTAIDLEGYQALVTLELRRDVDLPGNAVAELRQTSLLGEKFVRAERARRGRDRLPARGRGGHPDRARRAQPGGRGGARRAEPAAQRRRRRPAQDHHPGAQPGPRGPRGLRPLGAAQPAHLHRPARREQGRHRRRDRVAQPARDRRGEAAARRSTRRSRSCPARSTRSTASATTSSRCSPRSTTSPSSRST